MDAPPALRPKLLVGVLLFEGAEQARWTAAGWMEHPGAGAQAG